MTTDRCPGCHAAVTPGAPWCTLCYTDLRAPAPEPAAAVLATVPEPALERQLVPDLAPDPILDAPIAQQAPVARRELAGWPCSCGAIVPMADDACSHCGRSFLPADSMPSLTLPVVGDVTQMDRTQKIVVTGVALLAATVAMVILLYVAGSVL